MPAILPGSYAEYQYKSVPYAIWYDVSFHKWCVDLRKVGPKGSVICNVQNAAEAVLLGKKIIEKLRTPFLPQLRPKPVHKMLPPPAPVPKRLQMPERWHTKHEAARRQAIQRYKTAIIELDAVGPFRTEDLARVAGRSDTAAAVVVSTFIKHGYLERAMVADPVTEQVKKLIEERHGQITMREIVDRGVSRQVAKYLIKRMRQRGLISVRTPRQVHKGAIGASPAILELTAEGRRWISGEVRWQLKTRSTYPYVYYAMTAKGRRWAQSEKDEEGPPAANPISMNPALVGGIVLGIAGIAAIVFASRSSKSAPACSSWKFPTFASLPKDVVARTIELQHDMSKSIGYQTIEVWHGTTYRFNVRMHPANEIVNVEHRGADVEVCTS